MLKGKENTLYKYIYTHMFLLLLKKKKLMVFDGLLSEPLGVHKAIRLELALST